MFKRIFAIATLLVSLPLLAHATDPWKVNTWAKSQGGKIVSAWNGNTYEQRVTQGSVFKTYTSASAQVTVAPDAGFKVSKLTKNGIIVSGASTFLLTPSTSTQSITATFARISYTLRAVVGTPGGTVSPSSLAAYAGVQSPAKVFTFSPSTGKYVASVTGVNGVEGVDWQLTDAVTGNPVTNANLTSLAGKKIKLNIVNVTGDDAVTVNFGVSGAFAGVSKTYFVGQTVTLDGSGSMPTSAVATDFVWSVVQKPSTAPAITFTPTATAGKVTFPATVAGTYRFKLVFKGQVTKPSYVFVYVTDSAASAARNQCQNCHDTQGVGQTAFQNWSSVSGHKTHVSGGKPAPVMCYDCHQGVNAGGHPGTPQCGSCHTDIQVSAAKFTNNCAPCHGEIHGVNSTNAFPNGEKCIECHAVNQNIGAGFVQDNNGVRAIVGEFGKWSHHVTGVALDDAHCAACHLAGKASVDYRGTPVIVIDHSYHAADAKIHLRDTTNNQDEDFAWDPANPNHSGMDKYCMSCHDANGAVSPGSAAIQTYINNKGLAATGKTASAMNPFGDTISNRYDKMQRPAVVNVDSQFATGNNSHHAVKGPRYSGRTEAAGPRQITTNLQRNVSAALPGVRKTIYDAGNFNQLYVPLENAGGEAAPRTGAQSLGDDSTLHCGDCHTVGQWKPGSSTNADGTPTPAAIGAHGSNNEYMLRNTKGTDERHTQNAYTVDAVTKVVTITNPNGAFLVCFNCHTYTKYGSPFNSSASGHVAEYASGNRCNGPGNTLSFNGYTTGTAADGTQFESRIEGSIAAVSLAAPYAGEQNSNFRNAFGIQCQNCHNSGAGNAYGGIHGSANNTNTVTKTVDPSVTGGAYIDGMGNTTKNVRFLPGFGDAMHVPGTLGGFTGGTTVSVFRNGSTASSGTYTYITGGVSNDTNWEQKVWNAPDSKAYGAGCYTIGVPGDGAAANELRGPSVTGAGGAATELFGTWGGCDDHNAAQGKGDHGFTKKIVRPVTY